MRFASNGARPHLFGHTCSVRAEVRCSFETGQRLRAVNEMVPLNTSAADLLSGEFRDEKHGAAAVRAEPTCGRIGLVTSGRLGTLLWTVSQQLLAEGQKLFPAPISEEAGEADADEPAR